MLKQSVIAVAVLFFLSTSAASVNAQSNHRFKVDGAHQFNCFTTIWRFSPTQ
jgi:hypothetical protein